jgi:hypothetical protein
MVKPWRGLSIYDQASPNYKCEGDEEIVVGWLHHWTETKYVQMYGSAIVPLDIPHGWHTHLGRVCKVYRTLNHKMVAAISHMAW